MAYKAQKLTNNENGDFTHIAVFDYVDIQNNATSDNQAALAAIPAGGAVELVMVYEKTPLVGASDITLDVGTTTADPDEFINALDVDGMGAPVYNTGDAFEAANAEGIALAGETSVGATIVAEWNGTVASLTAGEVVIGFKILDPGRFGK